MNITSSEMICIYIYIYMNITSKWSSSLSSNLHGRMASASPMAAGYGSSRRSTKSTGSLASGGEKVPPVAVWLGGWRVWPSDMGLPNEKKKSQLPIYHYMVWLLKLAVSDWDYLLYIVFWFDGPFLEGTPPKKLEYRVVHEELTNDAKC